MNLELKIEKFYLLVLMYAFLNWSQRTKQEFYIYEKVTNL